MKRFIKSIVWLLAVIGFGVGIYGMYLRFTTGHRLADYGSYIPWGLWVAFYIYFIGLSAGSFLLSTLVYVARIERLEKIGKLALFTAFGCLVAALLSIWMDLGHMFRVGNVLLHMNLNSMMSWMGILYSSYFAIILVELWFALRVDLIETAQTGNSGSAAFAKFLSFGSTDTSKEAKARDHARLRVLGTIGVPLAIAFHGGVGALFGVVQARPHWNSGLMPIAFLIGALASGGALLTAVVYIWGPDKNKQQLNEIMKFLGKIVLALILFDFLLEIAEFLVGLYSLAPAERLPLEAILHGPYWYVFWIVHFLIGVVVPVIILFARAVPKGQPDKYVGGSIAFACLLVAVTFIAVRFNIVIPAQINPEIPGLEYAFGGPGLKFTYLPSIMEWLVAAWVTCFGVLLFLVGEKILPIVKDDNREVA
ncbi:polysulfide reductase [Desulfomarina profundi]|uniref:Polysulfide reductase n=1 Tax=Desulfomarina profundi TaxID=2772557 RepID=A0A8D5FNC9_9BACT|nr:NrfD/PsrC family molybdoenzyme membrane anchor subunit [Desulfomarina profundi]BCL61409.1 polysulfide reductase [Desulfomarina profundi]